MFVPQMKLIEHKTNLHFWNFIFIFLHITDENVIKLRGEFTIAGIGGGNLEWMEDLGNRKSNVFSEFSNLISPIVSTL